MTSFLSAIGEATPDPFFVLNDLFAKDSNPNKVNLGIGIFKAETGKTPFMNVFLDEVAAFLEDARALRVTAEYLPIQGLQGFLQSTAELVLTPQSKALKEGRVGMVQTVGGTGALFVGGELLCQEMGFKEIYMSDPTWVNHHNLFLRAGFTIRHYPYRNPATNRFDLDAMIVDLKKAPKNSVILLHAACHNPTGIDPTESDWKEILKVIAERGCIPFFDSAYQGLGKGIDEDAFAIRHAESLGLEFLVAVSYSKNMSMYRQRLGALFIVGNEAKAVQNGIELVKGKILRAAWSNPPSIGAMAVANILTNPQKKKLWLGELTEVRERIVKLRKEFIAQLEAKGIPVPSLVPQLGMFSFTGLSTPQVMSLREKFGIYMTNDGRVNLAGLSEKNLPYVTDAVAKVVKESV